MIITANKKFSILSSFLLILIPFSLISGPFVPDLLLVTILVSYLYYFIQKKNYNFFSDNFIRIYFLICLYLLIISILTFNFISIKSSIFYFRFGLFALFASYIILNNKDLLKYLFYFLILIYLSLFFDSLYQYFFSKNILGFVYSHKSNFRITSFFGDDEVLGSYTSRFFPFLMFLVIWNLKNYSLKKFSLVIFVLTIITFVIILLSGERTSIGLFFLSLLFIFFSSTKFRKSLLIPFLSIILIFLVTVSVSEKVKNRVITQTITQMGLNSESERILLFSEVYEGHYKISYNMFKEKPLFGHGAKMFRVYCVKEENFVANDACTTHPHNFYAQMLSEAGLVGFIIMFSVFAYICYLFILNFYSLLFKKKQLLSDEAICILSFYFMTLFPLLPSGNFFNNWLSIIVYYPLGFLLFIIKDKKFYV